ncbi:MAG: NfeD family protein [Candidatus Zhuqueibacterota bacterium]
MKKFVLFVLLTCLFPGSAERVSAQVDSSTVYHVKIEGEINLGLPNYIQRIVQRANEQKAGCLIIEVDTPGGRVDAALQIRDAIFAAEVPVHAFINREAASAGALISLSCDSIYMAPGSSIGAVTPVDQAGNKASEKMVSYLRSVMRSIAQRNHRPVEIVESMVDEDIEIPGIIEKGKLLTLTADEAVKLNVADGIAHDLDEVLSICGLAESKIVRIKISWSEKLVSILTNPIVSSLLLTLGIFGLIFEIRTPGWGLGGTLSLIALALFFGSHYLAELAQWTEILLFLIGTGLLLLEVFVFPGFGIAGVAGIVLVVASFVLSLLPHMGRVGFEDVLNAMTQVGISFILAFALVIPIVKFLPKTRVFKSLILDAQEKATEGFRATPEEYISLLGAEGYAFSSLRPSGIGIFGKKRVDVVAEGEFVAQNERIKVIKVEGYRIIVRRLA